MNQRPSTETLLKLLQTHYNLTGQLKPLAGEIDWNYHLSTSTQQYIIKIAAPSRSIPDLEMENKAMQHLATQSIDLQLPNVIANQSGDTITKIKDKNGAIRFLRVLTWIEGRLYAKVNPHTEKLVESLGRASALLCKGLSDFDHPSAHRDFKWNSSTGHWIKEHLTIFKTPKQQKLAQYFYQLFENQAVPLFPQLRQSIIHNDANDYNVLVNSDRLTPTVVGVIDFGDMIYAHTVNDLAIALAYAMMNKPDPLAIAAHGVKGFYQAMELTNVELQALFPLIGMRLLISVTVSTLNARLEPDNEYLQISAKPAWALLEKMQQIHPNLAYYTFRNACGLMPCPKEIQFKDWAKTIDFAPIIQPKLQETPYTILDCSVGSLDLGNNEYFEDAQKLNQRIDTILAEHKVSVGIGQYGEIRPFYTTDSYLVKGNQGPEWRTVHLGIDVFMKAETPIYAPLDGIVHSFQNNAQERDYGPTIILEHKVSDNFTFYTLYGHLSLDALDGLYEGKVIKKGEAFCKIGTMPINGNWPPHLHFQVMLDMVGNHGDFPGVAFPSKWSLWSSLCPDPNLILKLDLSNAPSTGHSIETILKKRHNTLGRGLSISYQKPLKMVRGFKQYLYDETGRRYLDMVNNVAHVGHEHPKVVKAAQRQMAVLNTNTRYLHDNLVDYAEALLAKFPPELCVCHFVNSGSEANELALRMARTYSNQQDMIVIDVGYHGNTGATIDVSPYKFDSKGGTGAKSHIHKVPMPDTYRGEYKKDDLKAGEKYATHVQTIIERLTTEGKGIAGFIGESVLSCGGQVEPPPNYFKTVYQYVRQAGGLCIADEVQVGFGRVGTHFWGFELQDVIPDIVTMGKPIGNGHPLAAVVTTRKVADAFANGMEYFNTFGGNPVSCAIGQAVLKVIEEEKLQDNALNIGAYLKEQLTQLMSKYPLIGDVRGPGLFLGFELVEDTTTLEPAEAKATYLVNRAREQGILLSTDGPYHNVIKIKPPMVLTKENVDFVIEVLDEIFGEDFMG